MRWASSSALWSWSSALRSWSCLEISVLVMAFQFIGTEEVGANRGITTKLRPIGTRPLPRLLQLRVVDLLLRKPGDRRQLRHARHPGPHLHPALLVLPYEARRPGHAEAVHQLEIRLELRLERLRRLRRRDPAVVTLRAVADLVLAHRRHAVLRLHDRRRFRRRTVLLIRHRHPAHLQPGFFVNLQRLPRQMAVPTIRVEENVEDALRGGW